MAEKKGGVSLIWQISIGFIAGIVFGRMASPQVVGYVAPLGSIFMALLNMLIVPLVLSSLIVGVASLGDLKALGRIGVKTVVLYLLTTAAAIAIGLALGNIMQPGAGMDLALAKATEAKAAPSLGQVLTNMFPKNAFAAMVNANMLQIIVLSFFIGLACLKLDEKERIVHGFETAQQICIRIANMVMHLAPLGVFCLLYPVVAKNLAGVVMAYVQMTAMLLVGLALYMAFCSLPLLFLFKVDKPFAYFKTIILGDVVGAIAGGSMTYMAPRIANLKKHTALNPDVIDFFIPITAVLTRMGSCICVGIYTVFAASIFHITLSWEQLIVCALLTIIALMCAPGIIGGTLMDCAIIWSAIGIPIEAIAYIAGIDYIIDVIRTVLNIQGGEIITACMNHFSSIQDFSYEKGRDVSYE